MPDDAPHNDVTNLTISSDAPLGRESAGAVDLVAWITIPRNEESVELRSTLAEGADGEWSLAAVAVEVERVVHFNDAPFEFDLLLAAVVDAQPASDLPVLWTHPVLPAGTVAEVETWNGWRLQLEPVWRYCAGWCEDIEPTGEVVDLTAVPVDTD